MKRIVLNEDSSHFFCWHPHEEMTEAGLDAWLDQYADTQVGELIFDVNAQRSSVASEVRQTVWDGYDPNAGNDQPFLAGITDQPFVMPHGAREHYRRWAHAAWLLHDQGIDPYARWIERSRKHGIVPFISIRMNDVHYVDQPEHPIHDRFWKEHPEYRRAPDQPYNGQCLDYGRHQVRDYVLSFIGEMVNRNDLDGLELDWMRNPFHLKPGEERKGRAVLTEFTAKVRSILDERSQEIGHPIQLRARVPWRPQTALGLGMDVKAWAEGGLIDKVDPTPFLHDQFDLPVEDWKALIKGTDVSVSAGLMQGIRPTGKGGHRGAPNLEAVRGAASCMLGRGADQIYLFNFMDNHPFGNWGTKFRSSAQGKAYDRLLREVGSLQSMAGKSRRHILAIPDTWAPDEVPFDFLPCDLSAAESAEFRIHIGPQPASSQQGEVRLAIEKKEEPGPINLKVKVNGQDCPCVGVRQPPPEWEVPDTAFEIPAGTLQQGYNEIEVRPGSHSPHRLVWLELAISARNGEWPSSGIEMESLHPSIWKKK